MQRLTGGPGGITKDQKEPALQIAEERSEGGSVAENRKCRGPEARLKLLCEGRRPGASVSNR